MHERNWKVQQQKSEWCKIVRKSCDHIHQNEYLGIKIHFKNTCHYVRICVFYIFLLCFMRRSKLQQNTFSGVLRAIYLHSCDVHASYP